MNTNPTDDRDGDAPLSPQEMLELLENQRRSVEGQVAGFVPWILLVWGVAWFVGFIALWLVDGLQPAFSLPVPIAATVFAVLIGIGVIASAVLGARSGRGMRGNTADAFQGIVYGFAWMIGGVSVFAFGQGLFYNGMDSALAAIYYPVAYVLLAGLMYVVSGAMWRAVPSLILGIWTIIVGIIAPFFGYPSHYLFLAIAGGLGLIVLAVISFAHIARLRLAVARAGEADRG